MFKLFFPLIIIMSLAPGGLGIFDFAYGAQIEGRVDQDKIQWVIPDRIYQIHIKLKDCDNGLEFICPDYYTDDINALGENDIIVGIKVVPELFRKYPTNPGSPPEVEYCPRIGKFMGYLKTKFPQITAFELFNEPDVPLDIGNTFGEYFGAWVENGDYYNSGKYYGRCTRLAIEEAKIIDSDIKVLIGALIGGETSFTFLQGALVENDVYDGVSFHKYLYLTSSFEEPFIYARRLREYTAKEIVLTETSVLADIDSIELDALQAQYISFLIYNASFSDISAWLWYTLANNGWRNSDLVFNNLPKPAYYTFVGYPGVGGGKEMPEPNYILIVIIIIVIMLITIAIVFID